MHVHLIVSGKPPTTRLPTHRNHPRLRSHPPCIPEEKEEKTHKMLSYRRRGRERRKDTKSSTPAEKTIRSSIHPSIHQFVVQAMKRERERKMPDAVLFCIILQKDQINQSNPQYQRDPHEQAASIPCRSSSLDSPELQPTGKRMQQTNRP
jgi:hypothetical protein